jgi:hypothetical protein
MNIVVPPSSAINAVLTSGTVGATVIDTVLVVEHAMRRCGKSPSALTPEILDMAKQNLHFILSSLSNRGVNLWAVDEQSVALQTNQSKYLLPEGTESIINAVTRKCTRLLSDNILDHLPYCSAVLKSPVEIKVFGFKLLEALSRNLVLESTPDGITWELYEQFGDVTLAVGWHWYTLDPTIASFGLRVRDIKGDRVTVADIMLSNAVVDKPIERMNRDTYTGIPNKFTQGNPNNYFFDKQIDPSVRLYPVPIDDTIQLVVWRQRRIQDVGSLSQKLEIPERWFESVIWSLSKNMAFELEGVDPARIALCKQESIDALQDAELGESDQAPMYIKPNIRGYTA